MNTLKIPFYKYQGTGNDFVLIDQRKKTYLKRTDHEAVALLCDRKFGVGADGLILLEEKAGYDFEMVYFNSDGYESSMCGNGGRCITAFAQRLGVFERSCRFWAIDGLHEANVIKEDWVELKMMDVDTVEYGEDYFVLNTGSPHYIVFVEDVDDINVVEIGSAIRYSKPYREKGINVNFVEKTDSGLIVATYERGVEDETLSCGTGVTAAAIALASQNEQAEQRIPIQTKGGNLEIKLQKDVGNKQFSDIWLCGPAKAVFEGEIELLVKG